MKLIQLLACGPPGHSHKARIQFSAVKWALHAPLHALSYSPFGGSVHSLLPVNPNDEYKSDVPEYKTLQYSKVQNLYLGLKENNNSYRKSQCMPQDVHICVVTALLIPLVCHASYDN